MATFYSFPHDFGERPEPIGLVPFPTPLRRAAGNDPTRPVGSRIPPCHFPNLRPGIVRRMGEMAASYYSGQLARRDRPSYLAPVVPDYGEMSGLDEQAAMRFPPGTRTVRILVIGPLTARGMSEDAIINEEASMPMRTLEATPRQVVEAEALARRSGLPLDLILERVIDADTAYPQRPTWTGRVVTDAIGRAMADAMDRRVTALLWDAPVFSLDDEATREWLERTGVELPDDPQSGRYLTGRTLIDGAKTLRQRCFARLVNWFNNETGELILAHAGKHMVKPLGGRLPNMMAACRRDPKARKALAALPISRAPYSLAGDPEVVEALQDLADIVAWEARSAFTEAYYPGVQGVDPMTDGQVDTVMEGMQREVDREHRGKQVPYYGRLPRARQVALAERRRHWFGVFGITPRNWKSGTWSLWRVSTAPFPEGCERCD